MGAQGPSSPALSLFLNYTSPPPPSAAATAAGINFFFAPGSAGKIARARFSSTYTHPKTERARNLVFVS